MSDNVGEFLKDLTVRELHSELINSFAERAGSLAISDVVQQYNRDRFIAPSNVNQREILRFSNMIAETIPGTYKMIELSPVTSLGSISVLSPVSQNTVLTTIRGNEVVADGVTSLTLEAAKQVRAGYNDINLATVHRELRTQMHEQPGFLPHFHALSIISSSISGNRDIFTGKTFTEHVKMYLDIIQKAKDLGYDTNNITIELSNIRVAELMMKNFGIDRSLVMRHTQTPGFNLFDYHKIPLPKKIAHYEVFETTKSLPRDYTFLKRPLLYAHNIFESLITEITDEHPSAKIVYDLSRHAGIGYYQDLCIKISASNIHNKSFELVDIGSNNWMYRALQNKKAHLVTGGMGTELFMSQFKSSS